MEMLENDESVVVPSSRTLSSSGLVNCLKFVVSKQK